VFSVRSLTWKSFAVVSPIGPNVPVSTWKSSTYQPER
jgi:hypothetical protein